MECIIILADAFIQSDVREVYMRHLDLKSNALSTEL